MLRYLGKIPVSRLKTYPMTLNRVFGRPPRQWFASHVTRPQAWPIREKHEGIRAVPRSRIELATHGSSIMS